MLLCTYNRKVLIEIDGSRLNPWHCVSDRHDPFDIWRQVLVEYWLVKSGMADHDISYIDLSRSDLPTFVFVETSLSTVALHLAFTKKHIKWLQRLVRRKVYIVNRGFINCVRDGFIGKSDRLVLPKNLTFYGKPANSLNISGQNPMKEKR